MILLVVIPWPRGPRDVAIALGYLGTWVCGLVSEFAERTQPGNIGWTEDQIPCDVDGFPGCIGGDILRLSEELWTEDNSPVCRSKAEVVLGQRHSRGDFDCTGLIGTGWFIGNGPLSYIYTVYNDLTTESTDYLHG